MKLLTKALREKLLDNGRRQAAIKGTPAELDLYPVVKLFNPCGAATWLLTEIDPEDESVAWGLCDLGMDFPEFVRVNFCSAAVLIALASARGWQNHAATHKRLSGGRLARRWRGGAIAHQEPHQKPS